MNVDTTPSAVNTDTTTTDSAPVKQDFLSRLGMGQGGLAKYHPAYKEPVAVQEPVVTEQPVIPTGGKSEVEELKRQVAELTGAYNALKNPVKEEVHQEPEFKKNEFYHSTKLDIGDAPDYLLEEAVNLKALRYAYSFQVDSANEAQALEAKNKLAAYDKRLSQIKREANDYREKEELRKTIAELKNPKQDFRPQIEKMKADFLTPDSKEFASSFPRIAHALTSNQITMDKIHSRLDKIKADDLQSWANQADQLLLDLEDLFPEAPKVQNKAAPVNPAAKAPRPSGGQTATRPKPRNANEQMKNILDRWRAA